MSIAISLIAENEIAREMRLPRRIIVRLECEEQGGLFCRGSQEFQDEGGYISVHGLAMFAGWLERQSDQGRQWICPACSGKRS